MTAMRTARGGIFVFLLGTLAGLAMVFVFFHSQSLVDTSVDPYQFGIMGKALAAGKGFLEFGVLLKRRSPLYPSIIGGIYALFGERPRVVLLLQCCSTAAPAVSPTIWPGGCSTGARL